MIALSEIFGSEMIKNISRFEKTEIFLGHGNICMYTVAVMETGSSRRDSYCLPCCCGISASNW